MPHQLAECIGLVLIQVQADMVTDMMMIAMKVVMEAGMKIGMAMGEREKQVIGMMTGMVDMGTHTVVMVIVMAKIMKNGTTEMVTGMMIIGEEVRVLMITNMAQEVGASIEREIVLLMMMVNILLGMYLLMVIFMLLMQ